MFMFRSRMESVLRAVLIAMILFNTLLPTAVSAKSVEKPENNAASIGKAASHPNILDRAYSVLANLIPGTPWGYWNLNEGSGTTAYDLGSGAHNGTINGTAVWVNGRYYDPN